MRLPSFDDMSPELQESLIASLPYLRTFARRLTRSQDQADDLVNDSVIKAIGAAGRFTPGTNFKAWMFTILRNLYYNERRKWHMRRISLEDSTVLEPMTPAPQEARLTFNDFRKAFGQLNPEQRRVLILVGAHGLSYEEAAHLCRCRVGTIKSRTSRARSDLRALMENAPLDRGIFRKKERQPIDLSRHS